MTKKNFLILVIAIFTMGSIYGQTNNTMAPNTITVDFGPTIIGASMAQTGNLMGEEGLSTSGFGIAAQYERNITRQFSVAGRFAYLGIGMGLFGQEGDDVGKLSFDIKSFSVEGHGRFYPFRRETFFLDAMLGYGNLTTEIKGFLKVDGIEDSVSENATRSYLKYGGKFGWRFCFGSQPGGFVFEPAFGFSGGLGLSKPLGDQLRNAFDSDPDDIDDINAYFFILENFVFIGGPRVTLSFGWRF